MDIDELEVAADETDPNHYSRQGEHFDSISTIVTEYDQNTLPDCPRYEEIRSYLLANRAQGRLCLDIMDFEIPAYNLLQYIYDLGGITITSEEWIAFLQNCDAKGECFMCVFKTAHT